MCEVNQHNNLSYVGIWYQLAIIFSIFMILWYSQTKSFGIIDNNWHTNIQKQVKRHRTCIISKRFVAAIVSLKYLTFYGNCSEFK